MMLFSLRRQYILAFVCTVAGIVLLSGCGEKPAETAASPVATSAKNSSATTAPANVPVSRRERQANGD